MHHARGRWAGWLAAALGMLAAAPVGAEPEAAPEAVLAALEQGTALMKERRYAEALPLLESARDPIREHFGASSPVLANVLNGLGLCALRVGRDREAQAAFTEAYACVEGVETEGDGTPGAILRNLGELHWSKRRYQEAAQAFQGAWARWEKTFGADHLLVASAQIGLGAAQLKLQQQDEALGVLERALAIVEATRAKGLPAEGEAIENLTIVDEDPGLVVAAIAGLERALPLRELAFGKTHPEVARHRRVLDGLRRLRGPEPTKVPEASPR